MTEGRALLDYLRQPKGNLWMHSSYSTKKVGLLALMTLSLVGLGQWRRLRDHPHVRGWGQMGLADEGFL